MVAGHASYLFNDALKRRRELTHSAACLHADSPPRQWFRLAADQSYPDAQYNLAFLIITTEVSHSITSNRRAGPTGRVPLEQLLVATVWPAANSVEPRHPCKQGRAANAIDSPNREITAKPLQKKIRYCSHAK